MSVIVSTLKFTASARSRLCTHLLPSPAFFACCSLHQLAEFDLSECDELEVARQLTLLDFAYFRHIMPRECVDCAWSKKDREAAAPHICAMIDQFNAVSRCVCVCVCVEWFLWQREYRTEPSWGG